jgi:hypothetical protein
MNPPNILSQITPKKGRNPGFYGSHPPDILPQVGSEKESDIYGTYPPDILTLIGPKKMNWRFRVPDGEEIAFVDGAS